MSNYFIIKLPRDNVNDELVRILEFPFKNGDSVEKGTIVLEYETSKAIVEIESEFSGFIEYLCKPDDEIAPGSEVIKIYQEKFVSKPDVVGEAPNFAESQTPQESIIFSNEAKKLIKQYNLNEKDFSQYDFVTKQHVLQKLDEMKVSESEVEIIDLKSNESDSYESKPISNEKKREISHLKSVQKSSLTCSLFINVNLKNILSFIKTNAKVLPDSILPIVCFEISRMLLKYEEFNSFFQNDCINTYKKINIGFAIDIGKGLRVLTIYNTNEKSFNEIEQNILELSNKYLDDQLKTEDLTNSTFTVSDLSSNGPTFFAPLINYNQSAILGISQIDPFSLNSIFVITFDHRILTGKIVSEFLSDLKCRLESYLLVSGTEYPDVRCSNCMISLQEDEKLNQKFSRLGFVKIIDYKGEDKYLCLNCMEGW